MQAELLHFMGDDRMIANAARVSFDKEVEVFGENDKRLINYLIKHKHTSPFRHPQLQFRVHCPIFVERQLFKHQVGLTANSISGRYVDFSDEYYKATILRIQSKDSKQGSDGVLDRPDLLAKMEAHNRKSAELYAELCDAGVAKEQARIILPLSLMTKFIWTGSLAAFLHMFSLRIKPDAQQETREVAQQMLELVQDIDGNPFQHTLDAFNGGTQ